MFNVEEDLAALPASPDGVCTLIASFLRSWQVIEVGEAKGEAVEEVVAAEQRLALRLPYALRWALTHIGFDNRVIGNQDPIVHPRSLEVDEQGVLAYRLENQNCAAWGVAVADLGQADPPVLWKDLQAGSGDQWMPFQGRMSVDLLELAMNEAMLRPGAHHLQMEVMDVVPAELSSLRRLAIASHVFWAVPDGPPVKWFARGDCVVRNDGDIWLSAFGRTAADLEVITHAIPGQWEALDD